MLETENHTLYSVLGCSNYVEHPVEHLSIPAAVESNCCDMVAWQLRCAMLLLTYSIHAVFFTLG